MSRHVYGVCIWRVYGVCHVYGELLRWLETIGSAKLAAIFQIMWKSM